ncbi:MAG: primosomal protein N' [Sulfurovaceae bacterium]|nr:primosomal protein N' [Sulfurovaceae bacterium]
MFTYHSAESLEIGSIVQVPVKSTIKDAVVLIKTSKPEFETLAVSDITNKYYNTMQLELARFISSYYFSSISEALALFIPFENVEWRKEKEEEDNMSFLRRQESIMDPRVKHEDDGKLKAEDDMVLLPTLTAAQQKALQEIETYQRSLLFGVTGAGKTEIFIHLINQAITNNQNVIMLMPEIALTPQMLERLSKYFGNNVVIWHSKLTKNQKENILSRIASGEVHIVAGARSALFVPLENIGLIIVDEEHDDSYKSMTRPRYHARDVAVLIGEKIGAKVVLASATPSASSYHKYPIVRLKEAYISTAKSYKFISGDSVNSECIKALDNTIKQSEQAIVFLPTRGNFKYLYCPSCGTTHKCPFCSVGMALHRNHKHLRCHYCGYTESIAQSCSECGYAPLSSERIGTKEAIELINESLPKARVVQFDKDSITTPKKLGLALSQLANKETDILVGTQMLSKGHDYPDITLSIIMGLDYMLGLADYRAKERAISLLFQIAGRSGRTKDALIYIQSSHSHFFEPFLSDYELFLRDELEFRRIASYPPFVSMARVLIAHAKPDVAEKQLSNTLEALKGFNNIEIIGYGKAPVEKIASRYRYHILLRSNSKKALLTALHAIAKRGIEIDMDPVDFS